MGSTVRSGWCGLALALVLTGVPAGAVRAQVAPFTQALAAAASGDEAIADWYRQRDYAAFWTGAEDAERRTLLLGALAQAADHGLPVARYDAQALVAAFHAARTEGDRGRLEIAMTRALLDYARDLQSGAVEPASVDPGIVREVLVVDRAANLAAFAANPAGFLRSLSPESPVYARLMKERLNLEAQVAAGGWGTPVPAVEMGPGAAGDSVVTLRNRLVAMGYLARSATMTYDSRVEAAVLRFQIDHGLLADGVADLGTIGEINVEPAARRDAVLVAMERLRWMPDSLGARHIWVNQTDFTAKIIDHGRVTFATRSVIGKNEADQRTPEFSDVMDHLVINPSWNVPRSITTKEYLPLMQSNPNAAGHLQLIDSRGRVVPRGAVNFGAYNARNFPFSMRQPPSDGNALGLVKFMFPNQYNIYLHDTPTKSLFANEVRAYSHGCIRLADPFDFAYALLAAQSDSPQADFTRILNSGAETTVKLDEKLPVHLVYFTAWPDAKGRMTYRRDVYGRDAKILRALQEAATPRTAVQG